MNNLTQDYRKEEEESKETMASSSSSSSYSSSVERPTFFFDGSVTTMAMEVVSDGKNDKTEKND